MKKKGFTLLEVLIGLAIFSILLIPTADIILQTVKNTKNNEDKQKARLLAQKTIEEIKGLESISNTTIINGVGVVPINPSEYGISAVVNGFNIEGKIEFKKPLDDTYNAIANMPVSCVIEVNQRDMKFRYSQPMSIGKYINEINDPTIVRTDLDDVVNLNITLDASNININKNSYPISSTEPIIILLNQDRNSMTLNPVKPVIITIRNGEVNSYDVYIVGNSGINIDSNYRIERIEGNINLHTSEINTDNKEKGIYSIYLQISKDSKVLENINTQKIVK